MKKFNIYLLAFIAVLATGCTDEEKFPLDVENLQTGAILRTIDLESAVFDFFDLSGSEFSVVLEADDGEKGDRIESIDVFVSFDDNSAENGNNDAAEILLETIPASALTTGPDGLPRTRLNYTTAEILNALSLSDSDLSPGDVFDIRLAINLTDGQTFTSTNASSDLSGLFYSSPFRYRVGVGCPITGDKFVGNYMVTLEEGTGGFGAFSNASFTAELKATTTTRRTFNFTWLPGIGGFNQTFTIEFVCFTAQAVRRNTGLGCGGGSIIWAPDSKSTPFDIDDDSSFTIELTDFVEDGGCGVSSYPVKLSFTKI
jgi:hypothetical protein